MRETCIWKGHFEKTRSWKVIKLASLKSVTFCLSWRGPYEVGKNRAKLEGVGPRLSGSKAHHFFEMESTNFPIFMIMLSPHMQSLKRYLVEMKKL